MSELVAGESGGQSVRESAGESAGESARESGEDPAGGAVTVHYWAAARAAAGG